MKSSPSPSKALHNRIIRHLREWHRKLGIIAAFFLIFLSLSGIALNHTDTLSLAHSPIKNSWLLDHYGIAPPSDVRLYVKDNFRVTDNLVWLDDKLLFESATKVIAIAPIIISEQQAFAVVSVDQLSFYNQDGELIDQLGEESGFPVGANAVAATEHLLVIKSANGTFQYNSEQLLWQNFHSLIKPNWITHNTANKQIIMAAKLNYRAQFLTLERIVLDAHSGRILGLFGVLFMDAVAILLILLSLSGIYIWIRYARARR
ncbi:hypothetical protein A9Q74_08020 [Colwellia sp. 39_35_sub15_T18]|nr:hypothetical protein A9Q74_08020 [Colwellia sp. 39_35_sub15_T18]